MAIAQYSSQKKSPRQKARRFFGAPAGISPIGDELRLPGSSRKKIPPPKGEGIFFGAPAGIRTPDTLLKRQVLCRLSYWVRSKKFCAEYEIKSYAVMAGTAGFAFQRESHGGSNNPPDYSQEPPFESKDSKSAIMAGTAGFEPANVGVKGRCLTAWRRPRIRLLETALP